MKNGIYTIILLSLITSCGNHTSNSKQYEDENTMLLTRERITRNTSVSEDGIFIVESGLYSNGGTSPDYWTTFKFINRNGDTCKVDFANSNYMCNPHVIQKNDGSTYYIVECMGKSSSVEASAWISAFKIENDTIRKVRVIDGLNGPEQDMFYISYNIPELYSSTHGAGYSFIYEYDSSSKKLFVPITDKHDDHKLTDHYQVWQFNGKRFIYKEIQAHKNLHPSLSEYYCLISYSTTKDYIVRVDSLNNGQLRYASWRKPKTMTDTPDIVLAKGIRRTFSAAANEYRRSDDFLFRNGGFEYIVDYNEIVPCKDDTAAYSYFYLVVKRNGKIILKQRQEQE